MSKKPDMRKFRRSSTSRSTIKKNDMTLSLSEMFERFMLFKETEGLTKRTLDDYYTHYNYLMDYIGEDLVAEQLNLDLFRGYIGFMLHDKESSPVTANVRIRTIRAFLRYCFIEGWIEDPIHERFKPVRTKEDTLESFTPNEIKLLLNAIDDTTYKGFRDKVIVYVLLDTMVRCSELIKIKRENVDLKAGTIQLEPHETKSKRARIVPLSSKTLRLLKEYIGITEAFEAEHLFLTFEGTQLSDRTIRCNLRDWGDLAGISNKRVSPHTFRHTGALFYILNGGDPFSLQKILGHSDMSMVRKYIQMTDTDVKRQHNVFSPISRVFSKVN
ncbi:phage-related integrase/recombinase [Halalkalibacter wakoensis JCM 9140]|uniref:Phage-related integrase/recombinase n=1 Tax=Halalkalibacter wakoensis JCM 9140 TaxID=1236970 RepID=W4PXH2_9BACI|nr:tyrosine-type recombinase/integrase [Halalkalibacter wakoensis]GAE24407.1 phage-related integrase/recombinase [Halalkalibacter wakoensis JCM 9140]